MTDQQWCHPRDDQRQRWVLFFDDADVGMSIYFDEAEALAAYERAIGSWTCHLFTSVPRHPEVSPEIQRMIEAPMRIMRDKHRRMLEDAEREADVRTTRQGEAVDPAPDPEKKCGNCHRCLVGVEHPDMPGALVTSTVMILCPLCGNKRCPHASDHRRGCTGSNARGQTGSLFE